MAVLIDVDGVVADLASRLLSAINIKFNKNYKISDITSYNISACLEKDEWVFAENLLNNHNFHDKLLTINGSLDKIQELKMTHRVVWVTSPWYSSPTWCSDRITWLNKHFGSGTSDVVFTSDKTLVKGLTLVDDALHNVISWAQLNPDKKVYLVDQPWNQSNNLLTNIVRINSIQDLVI